MKGGKDFRFCPANSQNRGDVGRQFARLCSLRVALVLSAGTGTLGAGEKPVEPSKVSITVTNQGYLELSLSLFQMVPPPTPTAAVVPGSPRPPTQPATHRVSIVRPATVQQKVKPNQGITFEIPEGSYAVHTSSSPQPGVLLPKFFSAGADWITSAEVWTFKLEQSGQRPPSGSNEVQRIYRSPPSPAWIREVQPPRLQTRPEMPLPKRAQRSDPPLLPPTPSISMRAPRFPTNSAR